VSLTAKNSAGSDTSKMTDFITVTTASIPTASFTSDRTSGTIPLTVRFNDTSSNTPTSWRWSFGDGTSSIEQNPVHSYTDAGTYTVALLTANDAGNNTRTMSNYITANSAKALTTGTTAPAATETTRAGETPAAIRTTETAVPASSSSPASPVIFVIAGVVIFIVIAAGVLLYSRNRRGGGHHRGGSQL